MEKEKVKFEIVIDMDARDAEELNWYLSIKNTEEKIKSSGYARAAAEYKMFLNRYLYKVIEPTIIKDDSIYTWSGNWFKREMTLGFADKATCSKNAKFLQENGITFTVKEVK